jgi:carboxymethylenebutenolidase
MILRMIDIQRAGGTTLPAFIALPQNATRATPCIVLAMHLWGVDVDMRAAAQRFADAGFVTIVPDLYARFNAPSGDGETDYLRFLPFAKQLTFEIVDEDIRSAAAWLRERYPDAPMAIAGFCMGGVIAWRRTGGYRDLFQAAAIWYGAIPDTDPRLVDIPVVASFGEADAGIPAERVRSFVAGIPLRTDVAIYPGAGHGFCDTSRASYAPAAAEAAWERTLAFLRTELGSPV